MDRKRQHILHVSLFVLLGVAFVALAIADMLIGSELIPVREVISSLWGDVSVERSWKLSGLTSSSLPAKTTVP